jgi:hypothetical protein
MYRVDVCLEDHLFMHIHIHPHTHTHTQTMFPTMGKPFDVIYKNAHGSLVRRPISDITAERTKHVRVWVGVYVFVYVFVCACAYMYMYVYACIYTHAHYTHNRAHSGAALCRGTSARDEQAQGGYGVLQR